MACTTILVGKHASYDGMSENGVGYINSIIRATNILELYNKLDVEYLGLAEISKELDLHKTTVFRVV